MRHRVVDGSAPARRRDLVERGRLHRWNAAFAPGRYRYVVQVGLEESLGGAPSDQAEKGITTHEERELYELRDEITIP